MQTTVMTVDLRLLGPIGFVIGWVAISLLLLIWEVDKAKSISHHAAAQKSSYVMMAVFETISMSLFALFTIGWLATQYDLPLFFSICSLLVAFGLTAAAWIPVTGKNGKLHDLFAWTAALLFMPILLILAASNNVPSKARLVSAGCLALLVLIFTLSKINQSVQRHHLYAQSAYILIFDIGILAAAYL